MKKQEREFLTQRLKLLKARERGYWRLLQYSEDLYGVMDDRTHEIRTRWSKTDSDVKFLEAFLNNN